MNLRNLFGKPKLEKQARAAISAPPVTYPDPALNIQASEVETNNWIISEFVAKHLFPMVGVHPFPLDELMLMTAAVCYFKPTHVFEWGTHIGKSARIFYETGQKFSIPIQIHSSDLPDDVTHVEHPGQTRGILVKNLPNVHLHQGDGLETSLNIYRQIFDCRPLFFVDGDHAYQSVHRELKTILEVAPAAAVLLHDTFYQSTQSGYNTGPYRAIQDVLGDLRGYRTLSTQLGLPGMTLVYRC